MQTYKHVDPSGTTVVTLTVIESPMGLTVKAGTFVAQGKSFDLDEDETVTYPAFDERYAIEGFLVEEKATGAVRVLADVVSATDASYNFKAADAAYRMLYPLFVVNVLKGGPAQVNVYRHEAVAPPKGPSPAAAERLLKMRMSRGPTRSN